jgi:hypothetical protein
MSWNSKDWSGVGNWLKDNAGTGAALVGSLLTGNIPGAVASGVALVTGATGESNPTKVLESLQTDPATMVRLKELAVEEEQNIRKHVEEMTRLEMEDDQKSHVTTQATIQNGDNSDDRLVRWTRPLQSWLSLIFAGFYVLKAEPVSIEILGILLALPLSYAGLRQLGKWGHSKHTSLAIRK